MSEKKSSTGLIIRIVVILAIGGAAVYWKMQRRQQAIALNERNAAASAVVESATPEPVEAGGIPESQKTPLMKKADALAVQVNDLTTKIATEQKHLDEMSAWLKTYEANELKRARESNNAATLESAQTLFNQRIELRNAQETKVKELTESMMKLKVELTNTRLDIATRELP